MHVHKLYNIAEKYDIMVGAKDLPLPSMAVEVYGIKAIALRHDLTAEQERVCLAHELGHHVKGALYKKDTLVFTRGQCEYKADKWAVHKLIPIRSLYAAFRKGYVQIWQLAEYFDVTEEFVQRTIEIYKQEGKLPA